MAHGANRSSWHGGMVGTTIGKKKESFTDLGFVDDVVLLAEMLYVLISALEVMDREASQLGMTINWAEIDQITGSGRYGRGKPDAARHSSIGN